MYAIRSYYAREETGRDAARGTKLNIPMPPEADDAAFLRAWEEVERFLETQQPRFILLVITSYSIHYTKLYESA